MGDLDAHARSIIDANLYITLATIDRHGLPWASPVYFTTANYGQFYWVSGGRAGYLSATAVELAPGRAQGTASRPTIAPRCVRGETRGDRDGSPRAPGGP